MHEVFANAAGTNPIMVQELHAHDRIFTQQAGGVICFSNTVTSRCVASQTVFYVCSELPITWLRT
jgi:hypothetical protein